jgi:hypothetical protein
MEDACVMRFWRRLFQLNCVEGNGALYILWHCTALHYAPPAYVPYAAWVVLDG